MQRQNDRKRVAIIVGAGPAGLTAAYELLKHGDVHPVILEADEVVGGLSRTVDFNGNRMDIGGHRFFSRNDEVMRWWLDIMPLSTYEECSENAMLRRRRLSRIFFLRRFFDYPIKACYSTFSKLGILRTLSVVGSYIIARIRRRDELSLEDFYINRFGKVLYRLFFEDYTQKVWGKHPSELGADWGSQRVKGLSLFTVLSNALSQRREKGCNEVETSLISSFLYPKFGPGQLWERVASLIKEKGGGLFLGYRVVKVNFSDGKPFSVTCRSSQGEEYVLACDYLFSSMPLAELLPSFNGLSVPSPVLDTAVALPYRDFITVGVLLDGMSVRGEGDDGNSASRLPDNWIYIQERDVKVGRIQLFNNWSPYMVADNENSVFLGLEYFCSEGDALWTMSDADISAMAVDELVRLGFIESKSVIETHVIRMKKAYPAYYGSYSGIEKVRAFLDGIENLYCIGRNGQHRYNNMDHSMLSAMRAVDVLYGKCGRDALWNVNTDAEYNEEN